MDKKYRISLSCKKSKNRPYQLFLLLELYVKKERWIEIRFPFFSALRWILAEEGGGEVEYVRYGFCDDGSGSGNCGSGTVGGICR